MRKAGKFTVMRYILHRSEGNIREGTFVKGIGKGQAHESWGTVMAADGGQT